MLYRGNNNCLEGRVQTCFESTAGVFKHDNGQYKLFDVKQANTTHRLLSITVEGIHIWNVLENDVT